MSEERAVGDPARKERALVLLAANAFCATEVWSTLKSLPALPWFASVGSLSIPLVGCLLAWVALSSIHQMWMYRLNSLGSFVSFMTIVGYGILFQPLLASIKPAPPI